MRRRQEVRRAKEPYLDYAATMGIASMIPVRLITFHWTVNLFYLLFLLTVCAVVSALVYFVMVRCGK